MTCHKFKFHSLLLPAWVAASRGEGPYTSPQAEVGTRTQSLNGYCEGWRQNKPGRY